MTEDIGRVVLSDFSSHNTYVKKNNTFSIFLRKKITIYWQEKSVLNSVLNLDCHLTCAPYSLPFSLQLIPVYPCELTAFPRISVFGNYLIIWTSNLNFVFLYIGHWTVGFLVKSDLLRITIFSVVFCKHFMANIQTNEFV